MRTDRWIERAREACPFCLQRYAVELERRCLACDRPVCSACATHVRVTREIFCVECDPPAEAREA